MIFRISLSILFCIIGILTSKAQLSRRDSIRLKQLLEGDKEIKLNQEAVKSIQFNFAPDINEMQRPKMSEEKPWMEFNKSLSKNFNDTVQWRKPKYIRLLPYTIFTRLGEDPVNDIIIKTRNDTLRMKLKLDYLKEYIPQHQPVVSFDAEKLLYENLTKRGRAIRRNRKRAKAWKIYNDYVPTKEDSLKWYGNKKRIPKDTLMISVDSIDHHFINTK
jgi:hypothetical protein